VSVHRHVVHHHPNVWRNPLNDRWLTNCACGWWRPFRTWRLAFAAALHHADTP
jgi:hypothetical protein